ncbi:uncharacterized protein M421DRAFT_93595 [Didymella exigua CBS 183.55]|uniref:Uncharacterized protein n=1 Tax=Didymella exigua CBS 183.55 TaxID=1150837 RepID=A0A6A5RFG6_9PLEO|nr:uncharacterized protein M421DRAFT_93595 [Didymella exigua CBS 183.55]KAF1927025.1 hypothetical protein M421DRAFT_93595 [Didymella exigua CBS 183.55]
MSAQKSSLKKALSSTSPSTIVPYKLLETTMPKLKIKSETSPEQSLSTTSSKPRGAIATLFAAPPADRKRDGDAPRPPTKYTPRPLPLRAYQDAYKHTQDQSALAKVKSEPNNIENSVFAVPTPAADPDLLPRGNTLVGGRFGTQAPPVALSLSSRPVSASKQTAIFTYPHHNFLANYFTPRSNQFLVNHCTVPTHTKTVQRAASMDSFGFGSGDGFGGGGGMDFNGLGTYTGIQDQMPQMVTLPLEEVQELHREVHVQKDVVSRLFDLNSQLITRVNILETRVGQLEENNAPFHTLPNSNIGAPFAAPMNASGLLDPRSTKALPSKVTRKQATRASAKRPVAVAFTAEDSGNPGRTKSRKKLQLQIPEGVPPAAPGMGIPTPMLSVSDPSNLALNLIDTIQAFHTAPPPTLVPSFPNTPRTPYTPGRIGPPDSYKKTTTSINKREIHNLNKSIPPAHVQLPMVPLTDTEVIVYFFNSLSKPSVSLRLYSRGWGPASIVQCLNEYREVDPPYLRNTCSVKCTTAIKLGRKLYGAEWEDEHRAVFADAEDAKATDLIRADENVTVDYFVRALGVKLKKHPSGQEGGIFAECVKYCIEKNVAYTMSSVFQLAMDLQNGKVPQHPASPALSDTVAPPRTLQAAKDDDETDGEWSDDEAHGSPSPLAQRSSFLGRTAGLINFTAGNTQHEDHDEKGA